MEIDGIKRNLKSRKYCLDCSPFGSKHGGRKQTNHVGYGFCRYCGSPLKNKGRVYCSNKCQTEFLYEEYIRNWKAGLTDGMIGDTWIEVSGYIRRYLFEKYDGKCSKCGWSERNPYTNTIPLEVEHIDGDATNNDESNLTLLCPNCHSLTKTYRGANKGNGKRGIRWTSRRGLLN